MTREKYPGTPEERIAFDAGYDMFPGWIEMGSFILPSVILWPVWSRMSDVLGPEAAAGVVFLLQIGAIGLFPHRIRDAMGCRSLERYREALSKP